MKVEVKKKYIVVKNRKEVDGVCTLELALADNSPLPIYCPGQFITVYFPEMNTPEGKAYSISSAPHENKLSITVKAIGSFSNQLVSLIPGDIVLASLPYGYFFSESGSSHLIMIASGIGVTPFRSMIIHELSKDNLRKITLLYSVKKNTDVLFMKEMQEIEAKYPNFHVYYFITQEKGEGSRALSGRITVDDILGSARGRCITTSEGSSSVSHREFMICGSISFVRDMWRALRSNGISEVQIYTEAFFSH